VGFVKTKFRVSNPANPSKYAELELLADTGATFTLVASAIFGETGVEADGKFKLRTANGRFIERDGSTVWVKVEGKGYKVPVILGKEADVPLFGLAAPKLPRPELDRVTKKLEPREYLFAAKWVRTTAMAFL
jgi:predicted aspartyl protease